jgi:hypothetical protein
MNRHLQEVPPVVRKNRKKALGNDGIAMFVVYFHAHPPSTNTTEVPQLIRVKACGARGPKRGIFVLPKPARGN